MRQANEEMTLLVNERTAALIATNRELEAFVSTVAHDLRSPLRSIEGFSQMLVEDYDKVLDQQGRDIIKRIRHATTRMGSLTDDLRLLSRLIHTSMQIAEVNLSGRASKILSELHRADPDRTVHVEVQPGIIAHCDIGMLRVALIHLLKNAWKFTSRQ